MKRIFLVVLYWTIAVTSAFAGDGNTTAVGVGVGTAISSSRSDARATAIGGGQGIGIGGKANATGGTSTATANPTVNIGGSPASTSTVASVHNSGSISNVPAVFAPGLSAAGLETCLGSVSVGASWLGTGLTGGGSIPDTGCAARLDARTLWSMGLKKAAVARLCLNPDIRSAMPDVCGVYLPQPAPVYAPAPFLAPARYAGGQIVLVEGRTGKDRLCNDYDEPGQKCRQWADAGVRVQHASAKRKHADPIPAPTVAEAKPQ